MQEDDEIKIHDKRRFRMDGEAGTQSGADNTDAATDDAQAGEAGVQEQLHAQNGGIVNPNFKISFMDLINSLAGTTLIQLGAVADPQTNVIKKDIDAAKQTIDILELLREKTTGNLSNDESMMLDNVLFDLRMRYVLISEGKK
jgi:hypothetical protein